MPNLVTTQSISASARAVNNSANDANERRFDQRSRLVLMLALLLLVGGVAQKAYRLSLPTTGWSSSDQIDTGRPVFEQNLLGKPSPLQPGDVFVAVEGVSFDELGRHMLAKPPATFEAGETVSFTVLRDGERMVLETPLYRWTFEGLLQAFLFRLQNDYTTLLALAITIFVFWQRPRNTAAQLLFLFYIAQLVIDISWLVSSHSVADLLFPLTWPLAVLFSHLSFAVLLGPIALHLCLSFPEPKALLLRNSWLLWLIYGLPWLIITASLLLGGTEFENVLYVMVGVYALLGALAFFHTFVTTTDPVRRAQVRWVTFGFVVSSLSGLVYMLAALNLIEAPLALAFTAPTELILAVCLAVAVLYYRLFDVDLIINRTLVYGALTACVIGLYILIVGGLGALLGAQGNLALALVGTGLVAVAFQPLRERLQKLVNRLMFGQATDPYALLTKLGQQIEGLTPESVLPKVVETVAQAFKLPYGAIAFYHDGGSEMVTTYGVASTEPVVFPLIHQGETFGEFRLEPRRQGESFTPSELHLLKTVAQQTGVAAYTVRQTAALQHSRERLITTREEERLRIRRDLHDGLGPTLAGLNLQIGVLHNLIARDPQAAEEATNALRDEVRKAIGEIRRLVYDLRPPSLDELGLRGALQQLADGLSADKEASPIITVKVAELPPLPAAIEVAVYRIVQEALTNAVKHAHAQTVQVWIGLEQELRLRICDDGCGLPEGYRAGVGLRSMRERAEEVGGKLELPSRPTGGSEVRASLPLSVK